MKRLREIIISNIGDKHRFGSKPIDARHCWLIYDIDKLEDFGRNETKEIAEEYEKQHKINDGEYIVVEVYQGHFLFAIFYQKRDGQLMKVSSAFN